MSTLTWLYFEFTKVLFYWRDCLLLAFETATNSLRKHVEIYFLYDFGEEKGHKSKISNFFTASEYK